MWFSVSASFPNLKLSTRMGNPYPGFQVISYFVTFKTLLCPLSLEGQSIPLCIFRNLQQFEQQHLGALPRLCPPRLHHWSHSFLQELPRLKPEGARGSRDGRPNGPRRCQLRVSKLSPAQDDAFRSVRGKQALLDVLLQAVQVLSLPIENPSKPPFLPGFISRPAVQTPCSHSWSSTSVWRN